MNIPDFLHGHVSQLIGTQQETANREGFWAVVLKAKIFKDGDMWCCLYGENLQDGVAAFGKTPYEAMWNFDTVIHKGEAAKEGK